MEAADYQIAWSIYLVVGLIVAVLGWRLFAKLLPRELAYVLECLLLALMYTPCAVMANQDLMAPALIVFIMDTITIDHKAGIRALIPLVLTLALALVLAALLSLIHRLRKRRQLHQQTQK